MGSSLSKSHLHRNYWSEETGQVIGATVVSGPWVYASVGHDLPIGDSRKQLFDYTAAFGV